MIRRLTLAATLLAADPALSECGGSFSAFLDGVRAEAAARGLDPAATEAFLAGARQDPAVLRADQTQGIFQLPFTEFARRLISANRLQNGARAADRHATTFDAIARDYGVPSGILLAFWAFETDFGAVQGDFNTRNALLTLAHDCRRPELFRPEVFAGIALTARGDLDPARTTGAWSGEIGQLQKLPSNILELAIDADGDGVVAMKTSPTDALHSAARMLRAVGWQPNAPWLQEVTVPADLDWALTGTGNRLAARDWAARGVAPRQGGWEDASAQAALILPQGRNGPAFLAYPNFFVLFDWNQSFTYVTTAAYFATRLEGAPVFAAGSPSPALGEAQMLELQRKLAARGHDVGGIDGVLGARTRAAVQAEQARRGLPADAWPTRELLDRL